MDADLVRFVSTLSRLTHRRWRTAYRLGLAHEQLRLYADENDLPLDWCDAVLLIFLDADPPP